jgi:hypothetical protein
MNFFNSIADKLDFWVMGIVLCSGFFQRKYLKAFYFSKDATYDSALKTLLVSAVASCVYIFLLKDPDSANNWAKYFVSYFGATSLYELLVQPFIKWVKKATGQDEEPKD